jgi:hypothetical protein
MSCLVHRCRLLDYVTVPRGAGNEHSTASNLAILDHLQDDSGGFASLLLANEALRRGARLKRGGIDTESADVRVCSDEIQALEVLGLGHGHDGLRKTGSY